MPLYEYVCPICGHKFEQRSLIFKGSDEVTCPKCGGKAKKVMSAYAHFKFVGEMQRL
jgi:putative FmdB family regulatory protein